MKRALKCSGRSHCQKRTIGPRHTNTLTSSFSSHYISILQNSVREHARGAWDDRRRTLFAFFFTCEINSRRISSLLLAPRFFPRSFASSEVKRGKNETSFRHPRLRGYCRQGAQCGPNQEEINSVPLFNVLTTVFYYILSCILVLGND